MERSLTDYANEIIDLMKSIHKNFKDLIYQHYSDLGFTVPQLLLIHEVYHTPGMTQHELSQRLHLSKSTVSGIIDRLEEQDAVVRTRSRENKRIARIFLTEKMSSHKKTIAEMKTKYMSALLANESETELENSIAALRHFDQLLSSANKNG